MATQAEAAATLRAQIILLNDTKTLVTKVSGETTTLLDKIKALEDAANNAAISPELEQAVADVVAQAGAVKDAVQAVDAKVPDAVPVPPAP